jgi:hypothetical protein
MGYNQQDANNLNRAQAMFGSTGVKTGQNSEMLTVFPITAPAYGNDATDVLAQALMSATRFSEDMTVWIDVRLSHIPEFVGAAIAACVGFGLRLVVTHGAACSHPPGEPLSAPLLEAIARASVTRQVWHPVAQHLVPSIKHAVTTTST